MGSKRIPTAIQTLATGNSSLTSFNTTTPRIYITAETSTEAEFDQITLHRWRSEGFHVTYIPYSNSPSYTNRLNEISRHSGLGDKFAMVAYGDAATVCLETFRRPTARLVALVAYYPAAVPDPAHSYPIGCKVVVHLAGPPGVVGVTRAHEVLGLQGKRKTTNKEIPRGSGIGGRLPGMGYPTYTYEATEAGFAEHDLEEFDETAERIAWSRSLDCVMKAFGTEVDLESVWDDHIDFAWKERNVTKTMGTMGEKPYVNNVPTMTGGLGKPELERFYEDYFMTGHPPSLKIKLLSRTIGVDRVVDEMFVQFTHSVQMDWILPGVPPTNEKVEVAMVSVVTVRGGKLVHENMYWDQASVLCQVGLLDIGLIPSNMKKLGIKELPVAAEESARKVLKESSEPSNAMIDDWLDD